MNHADAIAALCMKYRVIAPAHLPLEAAAELDALYRAEALRRAKLLARRGTDNERLAEGRRVIAKRREQRKALVYKRALLAGGLHVCPVKPLAREMNISVDTLRKMIQELRAEEAAKQLRCECCGQLRPTTVNDLANEDTSPPNEAM